MILVDTNVIVDVLKREPDWFLWSRERLEEVQLRDSAFTSPIVAAELARYANSAAELQAVLDEAGIAVAPFGIEAAHHAGRAYLAYRRAGGPRETILADLLIGGHAASLGAAILTRDPRRFRAYFPELEIIAPEAENG